MANDYQDGAISRRRFLGQSAMAAAALGAGGLVWPVGPHAIEAAGPLSPLQPPPDELLVTIQQTNTGSTITGSTLAGLTAVLNNILRYAGWSVRPLTQANGLQTIVFQGRVAGGPLTAYTVIRYQNVNAGAPSHAALLASATILAGSALVQAFLRRLPGNATFSVAPNWAIAAAGSGFIQGGPGGLPAADATCGTGWHFVFPTLSPTGAFLKAPAGATVVVLDTAPSPASLQTAMTNFPGNTLLGNVVAQLTASGGWQNALAPAPIAGPVPAVLGARERPCASPTLYLPYWMADHGLFVAGIVHDIAPTCTIRIVRVLNPLGASYLSDLLAGLASLSAMSFTGPVVVNMSLTIRMPSFAELQAQLAGSPYPVNLLAQVWTGLADACAPLSKVLQLLESSQVMLVAAAGNDSGNGPLRDPCAPAYFGSTLGVAAVDQANARACYSNRGDDMTVEGDSVGNGIATFGGDGSEIVHGLYGTTNIYLPPPMAPLPNNSGWAQWVGTSFATPVIAALAANYLANNPATSPAVVMSQIRAAGTMTDPALQAPTIPAMQVCS